MNEKSLSDDQLAALVELIAACDSEDGPPIDQGAWEELLDLANDEAELRGYSDWGEANTRLNLLK